MILLFGFIYFGPSTPKKAKFILCVFFISIWQVSDMSSFLVFLFFQFFVGTAFTQNILVYENTADQTLSTTAFTNLGYTVVKRDTQVVSLTDSDFVGVDLFIDYVVQGSGSCPPNWASSITAIQNYMNAKRIVWAQLEHGGFHQCNTEKLSLYNRYLNIVIASSNVNVNLTPYKVATTLNPDVSCILTVPNNIADSLIDTNYYNTLANTVPVDAGFSYDSGNNRISAVFGDTYVSTPGYRLFYYTDINNAFDSTENNIFANILNYLLNGCSCNPATQCNGFDCGVGLCGGDCGTCPPSDYCDASHTCVCNTAIECNGYECGTGVCGGNCGTCPPSDYCDSSQTCVCNTAIECNGYECGTGVCGGNCGTCPVTDYCDASHTCVCNTAIECNGYECGTGVCGGNCGTCPPSDYCGASQTCVCNTAIECNGYECGTGVCGGNCGTCPPSDYCDASHTCVCNTAIECNGYECGTGACGGNCGTCTQTDYCDASNICQPVITQPKLNDRWIRFKSACIKWDTLNNFGNSADISIEYGTSFASSILLEASYYMPRGQFEWMPTANIAPSTARIKFEYPGITIYSDEFFLDPLSATIQSVPSCY